MLLCSCSVSLVYIPFVLVCFLFLDFVTLAYVVFFLSYFFAFLCVSFFPLSV